MSFSSLIAVTRTSRTMLNNSLESGHPCLVPDLRGNAFSFSLLRIMFAVGVSCMAFTKLRQVLSMPIFWRFLIMKQCWNYEQPNYKHWNWSCDKKSPKKQKPRTRWLHERVPSKTLSKNCKGRNTSKPILWGHHHPDTKTRQRQHRKRKLQAVSLMSIDAKILNKILNSATYQKAYTPWSSCVYSRDARIPQYTQINQSNTPY